MKKYFYKEKSNVAWEGFLTTKFSLLIDTRSSTDNIFHGSVRVVGKGNLLQIGKATESSSSDFTCYVFGFSNAVAHLATGNPDKISTIGK